MFPEFSNHRIFSTGDDHAIAGADDEESEKVPVSSDFRAQVIIQQVAFVLLAGLFIIIQTMYQVGSVFTYKRAGSKELDGFLIVTDPLLQVVGLAEVI